MLLVKVLERKSVIRFFGLALLVSPFVNIMLSISFQTIANKWSFEIARRIYDSQSSMMHFLSFASIAIGLMMLSGSQQSWKLTLGLLGAHILMQLPKLGQDLRTSWVYGVIFLANLGTFLFIADQLAFKMKTPIAKKPLEKAPPEAEVMPLVEKPAVHLKTKTPIHFQSRKRILFQIGDEKPWAQLRSIDLNGIELKCLTSVPAEIHRRKVEIVLGRSLELKLQLNRHIEDRVSFEFVGLSDLKKQELKNWLLKQSAAA